MLHAYRPDPQPICETTPEQMAEKLQRRCREIAAKTGEPHVQPEPPALPERGPDGVAELVGVDPPARLLAWCKPERGATGVRTTCGRFSCAKVTVNGKIHYELWRLTPGSEWFKLIATHLENFAQAQDVAEQQLKGLVNVR